MFGDLYEFKGILKCLNAETANSRAELLEQAQARFNEERVDVEPQVCLPKNLERFKIKIKTNAFSLFHLLLPLFFKNEQTKLDSLLDELHDEVENESRDKSSFLQYMMDQTTDAIGDYLNELINNEPMWRAFWVSQFESSRKLIFVDLKRLSSKLTRYFVLPSSSSEQHDDRSDSGAIVIIWINTCTPI